MAGTSPPRQPTTAGKLAPVQKPHQYRIAMLLDATLRLSVKEACHIELADGSTRLTSLALSSVILPPPYRPIWMAVLDNCTGEQAVLRYIQENQIGGEKNKNEARQEVIEVLNFLRDRDFLTLGEESLFDKE